MKPEETKNKGTHAVTKKTGQVASSIKSKTIFLFVIAIIIVAGVYTVLLDMDISDSMLQINKAYMQDLAEQSAGQLPAEELPADTLKHMFGNLRVEGLRDCYAYVVSRDGTMLYHPTESKIGQPVENEVVKQLVQDLDTNESDVASSDVVEYEYQGDTKFAAYSLGGYENGRAHYIVVVTAGEKAITMESWEIIGKGLILSTIVIIILLIVFGYLINRMIKPLAEMTHALQGLAELDLHEDARINKYINKKDEAGAIARAIKQVQNALTTTIEEIQSISHNVATSSVTLLENINNTDDSIINVDSAVNDIALGATNQAQDTQDANNAVMTIGEAIENVNQSIGMLATTSEALGTDANRGISTIDVASDNTSKVARAIELVQEKTLQTQEAVVKINEVTGLISDIAAQTNLLSLNASIEAARAGEAGRGFAVVAGEIGNLAKQSAESTQTISDIIGQLNEISAETVEESENAYRLVSDLTEGTEDVKRAFNRILDGVKKAIQQIERLEQDAKNVETEKENTVGSMEGLSAVAEENAASTEEVSAILSQVKETMTSMVAETERQKEYSTVLDQNIKKFKL